jgi:riboflavin synthase
MFTGIVTAVGIIREARRDAIGLTLVVKAPYHRVVPGESIAVDGACLTVDEQGPGWFSVHVASMTLDRTRFGEAREGQSVNLERALRVGDRLGGHLVQGHVDGVGTIERVTIDHDSKLLDIRVPAAVAAVSILLGSITVDGVSLTINRILEPGLLQVALIPFTFQQTTLGQRGSGDRVHLEADTVGKYVAALMHQQSDPGSKQATEPMKGPQP